MAKQKHYCLIKEWFPHRGETSETPAYLFCGGYYYRLPLTEVNALGVYTSKARAERVALKHAGYGYSMTEVVEIPAELVRENTRAGTFGTY